MEAVAVKWDAVHLLDTAAAELHAAGVASPRLDAEVLLCAALGGDRARLYARLRDPVPEDVEARFWSAIQRRLRREPVAYIAGVKEFWSLPIRVTPDVLIPRPETELLVESLLRLLREVGAPNPLICDVGTGSGCVAVALAREVQNARIVASDAGAAALKVASGNVAKHGLDGRITLVRSDLFAEIDPDLRFDAIVSNPPYVAASERLDPELLWEPRAALIAGEDGFEVVDRLIAAVPSRLRDGGWFLMEFGSGQEQAVVGKAYAAGLTVHDIARDLAGVPRVLIARRPVIGRE